MAKTHYNMNIAGCDRALPLCPLNENLQIGAFVIFGLGLSVEHSAKAPESFWINVEASGGPTRTSCVAVGGPRTPQSSVCTPT